jgi:uncharacterized protein (TIRG00374 family)
MAKQEFLFQKRIEGMRGFLHRIHRVAYCLIPAFILFLVFRRIDFHRLVFILDRSKPWLAGIGIVYYPLVVMLGAWRWRTLLAGYFQTAQTRFVLRHYWTGLALGYFVPSSLGWDAYRVAMASRRYGRLALNIAIIAIEKLSGLACCTAVIVLLSPVVPASNRAGLNHILRSAYLLIGFLLAATAATFLLWRSGNLLHRVESGSAILLNKLFARFNAGAVKVVPFKDMIAPMISGKCLVPVLAVSMSIQLLGGVADQIFFLAIGYKISIVANLFIGPVLFFVFLLPISFGSLGVREGAYILLYGLWGVPAEIALLVSFFNLIGVLLNNVVGGIVMLLSGGKSEEMIPSELQR